MLSAMVDNSGSCVNAISHKSLKTAQLKRSFSLKDYVLFIIAKDVPDNNHVRMHGERMFSQYAFTSLRRTRWLHKKLRFILYYFNWFVKLMY